MTTETLPLEEWATQGPLVVQESPKGSLDFIREICLRDTPHKFAATLTVFNDDVFIFLGDGGTSGGKVICKLQDDFWEAVARQVTEGKEIGEAVRQGVKTSAPVPRFTRELLLLEKELREYLREQELLEALGLGLVFLNHLRNVEALRSFEKEIELYPSTVFPQEEALLLEAELQGHDLGLLVIAQNAQGPWGTTFDVFDPFLRGFDLLEKLPSKKLVPILRGFLYGETRGFNNLGFSWMLSGGKDDKEYTLRERWELLPPEYKVLVEDTYERLTNES